MRAECCHSIMLTNYLDTIRFGVKVQRYWTTKPNKAVIASSVTLASRTTESWRKMKSLEPIDNDNEIPI